MTASVRTAFLRLFAAFAAALPLAAQNPVFLTESSSVAPCSAAGFLAADLDADGDVDLLGSTIATSALNDGTGRMVAGWSAPGPVLGPNVNPGFADFGLTRAVADVDGDGFMDLVDGGYSGSFTFSTAAWYAGLPGGGFSTQPHVIVNPSSWFAYVDAGDADGDGDVDLVALRYDALQRIGDRFLRNNGSGIFVDDTLLVGMSNSPTYQNKLSDLDGDGDLDMARLGYPDFGSGSTPSFVQENVGGVFGAPVVLPLTANAGTRQSPRIVAADVDGDGLADVVKYTTVGGGIEFCLQTAPFVFAAAAPVTTLSTPSSNFGVRFAAPADFDGDGAAEIAFGGERGLAVLRYAAGAWVPLAPELPGSVDALNVFDADGDGDCDVFIVDGAANGLCNHRLVYNVGGATLLSPFGPLRILESTGESLVAAGEPQATGVADLLTLNSFKLYRSRSDGYGGFGVQEPQQGVVPSYFNSPIGRLVSGDFDGDGDVDAVATEGASTQLLLNDGVAGYVSIPIYLASLPAFWTTDSDLGDLNGDGLPDLLLSNGPVLVLHAVQGTGLVPAVGQPPTTASSASLGDFDGDGDLDAALTTTAGFGVVWVNDGAGVFSIGPILPSSTGWSRSADFNGDGLCDVLIGRQLRLRTGPLQFAPPTTITAAYPGTFPKSRPVDVDVDGDVDLVFDNGNGLRNDGPAGFAATTWFTAPANSRVQLAQDLDLDGDLDFVISAGPRVLRNQTRQFRARGPLRLGVPEVFEVKGPPGGVAALAVSYGGLVPAVATPFGALAIDVSTAAILVVAPLDANGLAVGGAVLDPQVSAGLVGTTYFFQAVVDGDALGPRLTNAFPLTVLPI